MLHAADEVHATPRQQALLPALEFASETYWDVVQVRGQSLLGCAVLQLSSASTWKKLGMDFC